MKPYPKNIYQTAALIQKYKDAGLVITDDQKVETALNEIGFYRLRGYSFHLYDNATKKYIPNVTFDTICHIYNFDMELRSLLFGMTCKIEVALRSRFCEALLQKNDALIYLDPSIFKDKAIFWRNTASISSEIARSTDVFITHNYDNHDGQIPLWAAVEVMSFGTLSKYIPELLNFHRIGLKIRHNIELLHKRLFRLPLLFSRKFFAVHIHKPVQHSRVTAHDPIRANIVAAFSLAGGVCPFLIAV